MDNQARDLWDFWWCLCACVLSTVAATTSLLVGRPTWIIVMWFCMAASQLGLALFCRFPWRVLRMVINIIKGEP